MFQVFYKKQIPYLDLILKTHLKYWYGIDDAHLEFFKHFHDKI